MNTRLLFFPNCVGVRLSLISLGCNLSHNNIYTLPFSLRWLFHEMAPILYTYSPLQPLHCFPVSAYPENQSIIGNTSCGASFDLYSSFQMYSHTLCKDLHSLELKPPRVHVWYGIMRHLDPVTNSHSQ